MNQKLQIVAIAGLLLIAVATLMPMLTVMSGETPGDTYKYIYAIGAVLALAGRLLHRYDGSNHRVRRLYRIELWATLFFSAAAVFMFIGQSSLGDIIALTLAGAVIQVYTSIMIPVASRGDGDEGSK